MRKCSFRPYVRETDYRLVSEFLIRHHQPGNADGNWLEPTWEYMHFHPSLDSDNLGRIGLWETGGELVGVCHYEGQLGEAFFEFHSAYSDLRTTMLDYAEANLTGISQRRPGRYLCAYVNDNDPQFQELVRQRCYSMETDNTRPLYRLDIPTPFPPVSLPPEFRLTSLAEECDWSKVHRVLWRGFDHGDDMPMDAEELESRRRMFDTPKARNELKIAVAAPDGEFAAFCGMFYEPVRQIAYVEPVATDPRYRRMGLGRAAVLEGIRRCGQLGASVAYVGSDQAFYQALGFRKVFNSECWLKYFGDQPA